jgi:hypothetical protein
LTDPLRPDQPRVPAWSTLFPGELRCVVSIHAPPRAGGDASTTISRTQDQDRLAESLPEKLKGSLPTIEELESELGSATDEAASI